ncbi:oligoendopeptidase F [Thermosporothrix hazakensis]|jgi:oligoendopeptidase F|uniref:Oligoendopeptidase F n=2 Tax=Thermosporothrix TaxID=768650 RepID=A0A326U7P2_THEHA|nr:M3 family oligoendopeptidase [Thermosporothrix hazakensis]PZW29309.1 oligoendopeptidase F [Thermosporothrix hazakensis]BBH86238.1 oligoendopeptidase F [Thermosporothrix sp. COM3]GCE45340.1 oligoendopeptidase F [Thermosporothrix hazakensis]
MYSTLPATSEEFEKLHWADIEPWYRELLDAPLSQETVEPWLRQWSHLGELTNETLTRHEIDCTRNTEDTSLFERKQRFEQDVYTHIQAVEQQINQKLLDSGLEPEGFELPLRKLRTETELYREENQPLLNEERELSIAYQRIGGARLVEWEGKQVTPDSLAIVLQGKDRERREQAWRLIAERVMEDREQLDALWSKIFRVRQQIAQNAGFSNYREYRWQQLFRFDYTPEDSKAFHESVAQIIVPAASRIWEKRRQLLGIETLRPWDTDVQPQSKGETPYEDVYAILPQCAAAFGKVDPQLQHYFNIMIDEHLFDIDDRPAKAGGGYNLPLEVKKRPFIFGRAFSLHDVGNLICHEAGHAFHTFEMAHLPYVHQRKEDFLPMEFAEVASTSMEIIGPMHLAEAGLCTPQEGARLQIKTLESMLINLIPMVVRGDAFQHWLYENPELATDPEACGQKWAELTQRYLPDIDWSDLEAALKMNWQRVLHFYCVPFYYIEYAFAAIGAIQIWQNYRKDPQSAIQRYRSALALGSTKPLPELYEAAGAQFRFDAEMLQSIVTSLLEAIEELEKQA